MHWIVGFRWLIDRTLQFWLIIKYLFKANFHLVQCSLSTSKMELNCSFFMYYYSMILFIHYVMRCAPPVEYAQILEQVDIQESLKSYNTASKILKEKVWCSFQTIQWFILLVLSTINHKKHTNLHYKKLNKEWMWCTVELQVLVLAIFGWVKMNAALACVRSYFNVLLFYQRSCCPPAVDYFVFFCLCFVLLRFFTFLFAEFMRLFIFKYS